FSLTLSFPEPTMQPESSDGFASVGTILPEERAAPLPGGSFRLRRCIGGVCGVLARAVGRIAPFRAAHFAAPLVRRLSRIEDRVFGAALRALGRLKVRHFDLRVVDDFLRDG